MRRDTNNTSIRLDYSNVKGYWDHLVDTPGIQSRDMNSLKSRFFAPTTVDWNSVFEKEYFDWSPSDATKIRDDLNTILFWQTAGDCDINGTSFGEGFGAFVQGTIDANFWFGFSMIVRSLTLSPNSCLLIWLPQQQEVANQNTNRRL